jgi:hypothetical protein
MHTAIIAIDTHTTAARQALNSVELFSFEESNFISFKVKRIVLLPEYPCFITFSSNLFQTNSLSALHGALLFLMGLDFRTAGQNLLSAEPIPG